jgi:hypothetical protein
MARVEARCAFGYPTVVSVDPLVPHRRARGPAEPFPTRFWLTCPVLVEQVSRIEASGLIDALEEDARRDPAFASRLAADHARCAAERWEAADAGARDAAARRRLLPVLRDSGVGGVRDHRTVKCLHAQYAHHLARGNAVGEILDVRHAPEECSADAVRCRAFGPAPVDV